MSSMELVSLDDIPFPVRLDFTLNNPVSNLIEMRFMKGLIEVFTVGEFLHSLYICTVIIIIIIYSAKISMNNTRCNNYRQNITR